MIESIPGITLRAQERAQERAGLSAAALIALWYRARPARSSDFRRFHAHPRPNYMYRVGKASGVVYLLVASIDGCLITLIPKGKKRDTSNGR